MSLEEGIRKGVRFEARFLLCSFACSAASILAFAPNYLQTKLIRWLSLFCGPRLDFFVGAAANSLQSMCCSRLTGRCKAGYGMLASTFLHLR